jgi:hypothetical protein
MIWWLLVGKVKERTDNAYEEQARDAADGDAERESSWELDCNIAAFFSHGSDHPDSGERIS